ncbi:hypothetical protein LTR37_012391 [Vermiconidia calcicola]|uniref:Uncharacterized protein n=1 Tax=Vermiconidia calcicola TaxID=1690605 RepID=A0ACC3MZH4_9PEZI|nr:hypothetical protein LTR37_012391 [Vermiconidia calcicola]
MRLEFAPFDVKVITLYAGGLTWGNFQNVWPLAPEVTHDLRRVDEWLRVIGVPARTTGRPDLLEEEQFLAQMRAWAVRVLQETLSRRRSECVESRAVPVLGQAPNTFDADDAEAALGTDWMSGVSVQHPDVFPLDQTHWMEFGQTWGWL